MRDYECYRCIAESGNAYYYLCAYIFPPDGGVSASVTESFIKPVDKELNTELYDHLDNYVVL